MYTYVLSGGNVYIYVDGVYKATTAQVTSSTVTLGINAYRNTTYGNVADFYDFSIWQGTALTGTEIEEVFNESFLGTTTRVLSDTDLGFENLDTPADTDPFNNNERIRYTFQSTLENGTYSWQVRAKDPTGSNTWGDWTTARTFTISASTSRTSRFNGSTWDTIPPKHYNGATWDVITVTRYNGTGWDT